MEIPNSKARDYLPNSKVRDYPWNRVEAHEFPYMPTDFNLMEQGYERPNPFMWPGFYQGGQQGFTYPSASSTTDILDPTTWSWDTEQGMGREEGRGRSLRRRDSNSSILGERLGEIGRHHSSRAGSINPSPSREQSPFRPESPYYCPEFGSEQNERSGSPFATVNLRDLDGTRPFSFRPQTGGEGEAGLDGESMASKYPPLTTDEWYKVSLSDVFELVPVNSSEEEDLPPELYSPAAPTRDRTKRRMSPSPVIVQRKMTKSGEGRGIPNGNDDTHGGEEAKDPTEKGSTSVEGQIPNTVGSTLGNSVSCEVCNNFTGRPSDLRKHMKRHTRPYFCTYSECTQAFGSKFDWVRHERTRHPRNDKELKGMWCTVEGCRQPKRVFDSYNDFKRHHQRAHKDSVHENGSNWEELEKWCKLRMGTRFWCGFCGHEVEMNPHRSTRHNHIGDHCEKEGKTREDWQIVQKDKDPWW